MVADDSQSYRNTLGKRLSIGQGALVVSWGRFVIGLLPTGAKRPITNRPHEGGASSDTTRRPPRRWRGGRIRLPVSYGAEWIGLRPAPPGAAVGELEGLLDAIRERPDED